MIDVDTHLSEPEDLWTSRAPVSLRDKVPQVKMLDGEPSWVIDGNLPIGRAARGASSIVRKDGSLSKGLEFTRWRHHEVHPCSYDVTERLAMMDRSGVYAQIIYPNVLGFGGQNTAHVSPALRLVSAQIYNDAMAEMQERSGDRLLPMAMLPWWDVRAAVTEAKRARSMGLRGVNINSDPHNHKDADGKPLPTLSDPYWDPLWELCQDLDLPINFHIGASEQAMDWLGHRGWPSLDFELWKWPAGGSMLFIDNSRVMANIIYSGMLDRFPRLKFVSVESGIGWIPFLLESLDYQYERIDTKRNLLRAPSEYFAHETSMPASGSRNATSATWYRSSAPTISCSRPTSPTSSAFIPTRSPIWSKVSPPSTMKTDAKSWAEMPHISTKSNDLERSYILSPNINI